MAVVVEAAVYVRRQRFVMKWGVSKTAIAKDRRACGILPRPTGRRPESPLPALQICEADGCTEEFQPTRAQVKAGWGRFHSKECMATDPVRREASRRSVTLKNRERDEELARLADPGDLTSRHAAAELGVSIAQLQYYERHGLLEARRITIGGLTRRLWRRQDVERFKREWRSGGDQRRRHWLDEQFLLSVYEGRGLIARFAEEKDLTRDEARDVFRGRLLRRLESYPLNRRGRMPSLPAAEWAEQFRFRKAQLLDEFEPRFAGERPPSDWGICEHIAVLDSQLYPERWVRYLRADGEIAPADSQRTAERVWKAIKPLLSARN